MPDHRAPPGHVLLTDAEYARLLQAADCDDMIVRCETCGAWIDREEPAYASAEDFVGCWRAATLGERDECVSHRAHEPVPPQADKDGKEA